MAGSALKRDPITQPVKGLSTNILGLVQELEAGSTRRLAASKLGPYRLEHRLGRDSLWVIVRASEATVALRAAHWAGGGEAKVTEQADGWRLETPIGRLDVRLRFEAGDLPLIRWTTTLTPCADLLPQVDPRDVYVLGVDYDPRGVAGRIEAAQRGLNTGLVYFTSPSRGLGAGLYLQNFTALAKAFEALRTKPDGVVGGTWPELGYQAPNSPDVWGQPVAPLKAGQAVTVSDALLAIRPEQTGSENSVAATFLDLLGRVYERLDKPTPVHHDWPARAKMTLRDLANSPKATVEHWGQTFIRPYVDAEYPDSMVQLAVLSSIVRFDRWRGRTDPMQARLRSGVSRFHHARTGALGRYLSNVGSDKDADAVDSWYLYHPLMNLARLAEWGDEDARKLFFDSLDYTVRAARHFKYAWPIQFKASSFEVITAQRNETGLGQTDVGGLYAYVMLQAYDLSGSELYLDEAKKALRELRGLGFELNYQANLTAWGAAACVRLSRVTGEAEWMDLANLFLASFFHNTLIWESNLGTARHFLNFLGATCLQDAPYMAIYECYESVAAFDEILVTVNDELGWGALRLMAEYRRFAFDRSWSYYPDALPKDALATDNRNGHIDPKLSFPLEDLYADGQPAGQVGQEIYGCGAAMLFAAAGFHRIEGAPFTVFCDYPVIIEQDGDRRLRLTVRGPEGCVCALRVLGAPKGVRVSLKAAAKAIRPSRPKGRRDYEVGTRTPLILSWSASQGR